MDARMGVSAKGNPGRTDGGVAGSLFVTLSLEEWRSAIKGRLVSRCSD